MSLNIGDIVKITDFQSYLTQLVQNVYFYRIDALPEPAEGFTVDEQVCRSFQTNVRVLALPFQNVALSHGVVRMDNLTNGIDFAELNDPVSGTAGGDGLATFFALNFILRRSTGVTRNGSKRIAAPVEDAVQGNNYVGSMGPLNAFAAAMASPLKDGGLPVPADFATPVIVGRVLVGEGTPDEHYELDLTKINPIASAAFTALSTQRSRKAGHGV